MAGEEISLENTAARVVLIVNTASRSADKHLSWRNWRNFTRIIRKMDSWCWVSLRTVCRTRAPGR